MDESVQKMGISGTGLKTRLTLSQFVWTHNLDSHLQGTSSSVEFWNVSVPNLKENLKASLKYGY